MGRIPRAVVYAVFLAVFGAVCVSNFLLRRQLDQVNVAFRSVSAAQRLRKFRVGDLVPNFEARDRLSNVVNVGGGTANGRRILALVHPQCKYCLHLLDEIAKTPETAANVTVVSLTSLEKSSEVTQRMPSTIRTFFVDHVGNSPIGPRAGAVPQLLLLKADGKVSEVCSALAECEAHARECADCDTVASLQ